MRRSARLSPGLTVVAAIAAAIVCVAGSPASGSGSDGVSAGSAPTAAASIQSRDPGDIRIRAGLAIELDSTTVSSSGRLRMVDLESGDTLATGEAGRRWTFSRMPGGISVDGEGSYRRLALEPTRPGDTLFLLGDPYRGDAEIVHLPERGLALVNRVELEEYLLGVVPAEIGRRAPEEIEAVKAQAVAARTYAVRHLGRRDSLGFDLFASVMDQVYAGMRVEREDTERAVRETVGEILVHEGRPIRAYYHSTGGGRTAAVSEVWNLPDAPYLQPVSDRRPEGGDYCDISPRYEWEESWTTEELRRSLARGFSEYFGMDSASLGTPREVRVLSRSDGGRVTVLEVRTDGARFLLTRNDIRFLVRPSDGRILRSTRFHVQPGRDTLRIEGRGFGHGIGMCQWGAIGRARAGQSYREILLTYYTGAELTRLY